MEYLHVLIKQENDTLHIELNNYAKDGWRVKWMDRFNDDSQTYDVVFERLVNAE